MQKIYPSRRRKNAPAALNMIKVKVFPQFFLISNLILSLSVEQVIGGGRVYRSETVAVPLALRRDSLTLRAQIYYGDQDEETVAVEADFYLLDRSVIEILKAVKFEPIFPDGKKHRITDDDYLAALAAAFASENNGQNDAEAETVVLLISKALAKHQKSFARTNASGRGFFKKLAPGKYYLFGIGGTGDETIVWNLPVEIASGINSIELDQNNSVAAFPAGD